MADQKLWRGRKERKECTQRVQSEDPGLDVVHPHEVFSNCKNHRARFRQASKAPLQRHDRLALTFQSIVVFRFANVGCSPPGEIRIPYLETHLSREIAQTRLFVSRFRAGIEQCCEELVL